ncbi:MAG: AbrB/MazE/SpoVT family DNA-binding domain-containing protein [Synechococcaceae cyanobacterium ELA445]
MRSTITARGQTVIPAAIRQRFSLTPSQRLEWIVEADGSIRVVPVDPSPVKAFRGMGRRSGSTERLVAERQAERAAGR